MGNGSVGLTIRGSDGGERPSRIALTGILIPVKTSLLNRLQGKPEGRQLERGYG
jgi:hypothetical protein